MTFMGIDVTDLGLEKKGPEHELKKHAATIHCSNTLSLLQMKVMKIPWIALGSCVKNKEI